MISFLSFLLFTGLVGLVTYWRMRRDNLHSEKGYFLGGRSLNGWVIAGSLLMTNLSAANFTGMTAQVYGGNLSPIAWTVTVIPPLIFFAGAMLPRFLREGVTTIPEFIGSRFGDSTRRIVTLMFLFSFVLSGMPVALYGGAIAIVQLFDVQSAFGLGDTTAIWVVVWSLGIVGGVYALFGGLKGVAISDTLNGVGLLAGGIVVLVFGIAAVGHGQFLAGATTILTEHTEKLDAIGGRDDLVPFGVLFTGMLVNNLYYWCTNQFIIQRTFGARSLQEGQKGVLIAGFFKILNVFYIAIPGVIAFHLYGAGRFANNDWVYPTLIRDTMPPLFIGFFAAVIFGTVFSTFNAVLNSAVTLFAVDIYRPIWGAGASEAAVIQRSKRLGYVIGVGTMVIAPFIMWFPGGIFQYMVKVEMLFGAPILLVLFLGFFARRVSAPAANITIGIFVVTFGLTLFGVVDLSLHYLHLLGVLFVAHAALAFVLGRFLPAAPAPFRPAETPDVDLRPWRHFAWVSTLAFLAMIATYVVFSPLGLVRESEDKRFDVGFIASGLLVSLGFMAVLVWRRRRGRDAGTAARDLRYAADPAGTD
jgi:SSS family solute:Na+ symporter